MGFGDFIDWADKMSRGDDVDKYYFWMTIFSDGSMRKNLDPIMKAGGVIGFPLVWFRRELGHEQIFGNYKAANPVKLGHEIFMVKDEKKIVVARKADLNTGYLDDLHSKHEHFDAMVNFAVRKYDGSELFRETLGLKHAKIRRITRQLIRAKTIWEYLHISFHHPTETFSS